MRYSATLWGPNSNIWHGVSHRIVGRRHSDLAIPFVVGWVEKAGGLGSFAVSALATGLEALVYGDPLFAPIGIFGGSPAQ